MYEAKPGLVNGNIVDDLLDLCNDNFMNPFFQPYPGANTECLYCGATEDNKGRSHHYSACPVVRYKNLAEKHKSYIAKK